MKTQTHLKEAIGNVGSPTALLHPEGRQEILEHIGVVFADVHLDTTSPTVDHLAWAIFNRDAPVEERYQHANQVIDDVKARLLDGLPKKMKVSVQDKSEGFAAQFIEGAVAFAESATESDSKGIDKLKEKMAFLYPKKKTLEDDVVAGVTILNVLQPYIVDRMLELNIYDPNELKKQVEEVRDDCRLVMKFQQSASAFMEFTVTGRSTLKDSEMADQLFGVGPLFVQLGQTFLEKAAKVDNDEAVSTAVANIAKAFQEGVAMPDAEQHRLLEENLPAGLSLEQIFSSAKIAYVARTTSDDGREYATKIKRPGVEDALQANVRTFTILAKVAQSYLEAHGLDVAAEKQHRLLEGFIPLALSDIKDDMEGEMDFAKERHLQKIGSAVLDIHDGVVVPKVHDQLSDENHLTMELVPGERIENMPAHPDYLKNIMILTLEGRRQNFLHGDMHAGNVKALKDDGLGRIVAYDWGKSLELPKGFERNVVQLMMGIMRRNPKAMAKAYRRVTNTDIRDVPQKEIEQAATQAIDAFIESSENISSRKRKKQSEMTRSELQASESSDILIRFTTNMMKDHEAGIKAEYITYIKSMISLTAIVKSELAKPEYADKKYRNKALLTSATRALKEVYGRLPRRRSRRNKKNHRDNNHSEAN